MLGEVGWPAFFFAIVSKIAPQAHICLPPSAPALRCCFRPPLFGLYASPETPTRPLPRAHAHTSPTPRARSGELRPEPTPGGVGEPLFGRHPILSPLSFDPSFLAPVISKFIPN